MSPCFVVFCGRREERTYVEMNLSTIILREGGVQPWVGGMVVVLSYRGSFLFFTFTFVVVFFLSKILREKRNKKKTIFCGSRASLHIDKHTDDIWSLKTIWYIVFYRRKRFFSFSLFTFYLYLFMVSTGPPGLDALHKLFVF